MHHKCIHAKKEECGLFVEPSWPPAFQDGFLIREQQRGIGKRNNNAQDMDKS